MAHHPFTLSYYNGEELPTKLPAGFPSLAAAVQWAESKSLPLSALSATEWLVGGPADAYGTPERLGSCNLDEAATAGYTTLSDFC